MFDNLPHTLFNVVMALAVIGWLPLILFPRKPWANFWLTGLIVPLLLCLLYMFLLLTFWFRPPSARLTQFLTLEGIYEMFEKRGLLLVAWINIIAMDMVVGAWMARKATQIRMPYIYLLPCLILTFVFVGFGFTLYLIVTAIHNGGWLEVAKFEGQPPPNSSPVSARPDA